MSANEDLPLRNLLDLTYRVNPAFELVEQRDLPPAQRSIFKVLEEDPDHFGLLISNDVPGLGILAVKRESASLFTSLQKPGHLPDHIRDSTKVAGLVLDGILEVEWKGHFVTGPAAYDSLFTKPHEDIDAGNQLSFVSFTALKSVQELEVDDPRIISSWLYRYNCIPMSPVWAKRFAGPRRFNNALGLQPGGSVQVLLKESFIPLEITGWNTWQNMNEKLDIDDNHPTFKLYISPHPKALPEALPTIARCLVTAMVPSFKLGQDVFGILRPDKLIAYLPDYDTLDALATKLAESLGDCPAHGVPFSATLKDDGLLSWGMDPPLSAQIPGWRGIESWRIWITDQLARTIIRAKVLGDGCIEPWQFALLRLRLEGIHSRTWLPNRSVWADWT